MKDAAIVVTGGSGFIGSGLVAALNDRGEKRIVVVDSLGRSEKWRNLVGKQFVDYVDKDLFLARIHSGKMASSEIRAVFHFGACSRTTERDANYLLRNNTLYTRDLCSFCLEHDIPFFYASSAATYGTGEKGFEDDEERLEELVPANAYGYSKYLFDLWAKNEGWLDAVTGFKFFNVFGPNEAHKIGMTSAVFNAWHRIRESGTMRLFRSDHPDYRDGEQKRDFIYVKDVIRMVLWFFDHPGNHGIFNIGTGRAATWNEITECVFRAMGREPRIEYVDMPGDLKGRYQYYTCASVDKLKSVCPVEPGTLEDGVRDYVQGHLEPGAIW